MSNVLILPQIFAHPNWSDKLSHWPIQPNDIETNNKNNNNNNNNDIKVKEPDQTSRLTGPSNPADKAGEEEAEAKGDHWVCPEHLAVHKPGQNFGDFLNSASETLMMVLTNLATVTEVARTQAM